MKAWQFTEPHEPMVLVELPDPEPAAGEVVLDVCAAGLCHSDVDILEGGPLLNRLTQRPIVLGHEVSGVVTRVGVGVTKFAVGDRVAVYGQGYRIAPPGWEHESRRDGVGLGRDGGFAERTTAWEYELTKIPDGLDFDQAASATDAGMTAYHAIRVGAVAPGRRVGIIGLGGLGFTGARIAKILGAHVVAAETNAAIHGAAREAGIDEVVADSADLVGMELDAVIDYAGFGTTTAAAVEAVRPGGRVVQVGLGKANSAEAAGRALSDV
ncbi:alcohol dehydrogenase catalytic domain-containing protein [Nocardia carnea]|uniref:Alcohol dehydrogenase catalytic domain-containing protein n=1 Tax=Nocardia carnea TaxID=37328 RepID=A0ABW7TZF8_9NOCA|nr:alcohol dehydrogenase catalytic domain-containing protein [Nocardia carnea]